MANRSFLLPEDEYDDNNEPYDTISSRDPLEDVGAPAPIEEEMPQPAPVNPAIRDMIMKRREPSSAMSQDAYKNDPWMKQYDTEQKDMDQYREAKLGADTSTNIGQAFAQMAQGANTPQMNKGLYENIGAQNREMLGSKEKDLDRKRKVIEAIESRKSREALALGQREDRNLQRDMMGQKFQLARDDKQAREAKLSEKQLGEVQDFDNSLLSMKSVLGQLGDHSEWTGSLDGRVPDAIVSADQVAWRKELGRMVDQYRKLITGAGASNQELAKLESRLPEPTDTYANFVAKAKNFIDSVERGRGSFMKNLKAQGKNVSPFESTTPSNEKSVSNQIAVSNGQETFTIDASDLADAEKDGFKRL